MKLKMVIIYIEWMAGGGARPGRYLVGSGAKNEFRAPSPHETKSKPKFRDLKHL